MRLTDEMAAIGLNIPLNDVEEFNYLIALGLNFRNIEREFDGNFTGVLHSSFSFARTEIPLVRTDHLHRLLGKALVKAKGYTSLQTL